MPLGCGGRRFVYCPEVTTFCLTHHLITHGPWVPFVERALGLGQGSVNWKDHCMGIYALYSPPGAGREEKRKGSRKGHIGHQLLSGTWGG